MADGKHMRQYTAEFRVNLDRAITDAEHAAFKQALLDSAKVVVDNMRRATSGDLDVRVVAFSDDFFAGHDEITGETSHEA